MVNRFLLSVFMSGAFLAAAAADYFPIQTGNAWTFSYVSTSMPVVSNPPTTRDSGTVKWEVVRVQGRDDPLFVVVLQTRNLVHRVITGGSAGNLDTIFSPPQVTVDSVFITESGFMLHDWTGLFFSDDSCAFAVNDPAGQMPPGLSSKDTTVSIQFSNMAGIAGEKMIVSDCSCLKGLYSYSFTLVPGIGPVGASITICPTLAGSSLKETWSIISREYPTAVLYGNAPRTALETITVIPTPGRITCSLNLVSSSPVRIELLDVKGCLIKTFFKGNLNAGAYRYSWNIPAKARGVALLRVRTGAENRCVKIPADRAIYFSFNGVH
jgi:hypothetical protein